MIAVNTLKPTLLKPDEVASLARSIETHRAATV